MADVRTNYHVRSSCVGYCYSKLSPFYDQHALLTAASFFQSILCFFKFHFLFNRCCIIFLFLCLTYISYHTVLRVHLHSHTWQYSFLFKSQTQFLYIKISLFTYSSKDTQAFSKFCDCEFNCNEYGEYRCFLDPGSFSLDINLGTVLLA